MKDIIYRTDAMAYPLSWKHYDKENGSREFICGVESYREYIEALPSAEAVQGEWIITKEGEYDGRSVYKTVCSECGHETFYKANKAHFCPNCGAIMHKGGDSE